MNTYHKIQTIYKRDLDTGDLIEGDWSKLEFQYLKELSWVCTEKIDGTNIRVIWDGIQVEFKGKTDRAQMPPHLLKVLQRRFTNEKLSKLFPIDPESTTPMQVCLYGEGYGFKIQKGGNYLDKEVDFILFDVKIGNWWLTREPIEDIAQNLNVEIVPIIRHMTLLEAVEYVRKGFKSTMAINEEYEAEGLVCKPMVELFDRAGRRIIAKIKTRDFK